MILKLWALTTPDYLSLIVNLPGLNTVHVVQLTEPIEHGRFKRIVFDRRCIETLDLYIL